MLCLNKSERLKRTKYDPSEYVFPSLKRKKKDPSESNNESKSSVAKKKKKVAAKPAPPSPQANSLSPTKPAFESNHIMKIEFPQPNQCLCVICNCLGTSKTEDVMLSCSSCTSKAHSNCIKGVKDPNTSPWVCSRCEEMDTSLTCTVCDKGISKLNLASCSSCKVNYHRICHKPIIHEAVDSSWKCYDCLTPGGSKVKAGELQTEIKQEDCSDQTQAPFKSQEEPASSLSNGSREMDAMEVDSVVRRIKKEGKSSSKAEPDPFLGVPVDPSIPDPSSWSPAEVCQYFEKFFSKEVASVFQEQDIDGKALLLLSRSDILRGLGLKVGVALKIIYHVKKFQIRRSDLRLLWTL